MPFCASCGAPVEGRFCAKCGATVGGAPPAGGAAAASQVATPMADNVASALSYVFPINIVFLAITPYNRNPIVRFHSFQSLFLDVACIALWIALGIVWSIVVSVVGFWAIWPLFWLVRLAVFGLWLYLVIQTYSGKTIVLPIIGPIAQQQARVQ
jgi:uncharacterized membrane protein